jgi:hypothetical protein
MRRTPTGYLGLGLCALALTAAACGGGSGPGVAQLSSATTAQTASSSGGSGSGGLLAYAQCMRSHGVPNFPDPSGSGAISISSSEGIDPNSPQFQAAQKSCQSLRPKPSPAQRAQAQQNLLKFSQCMRSHGVTNFPDPQFSSGGARLRISSGSGVDPNSPQFQAAQQTCSRYAHLPTPSGGFHGPGSGASGSGEVIGG